MPYILMDRAMTLHPIILHTCYKDIFADYSTGIKQGIKVTQQENPKLDHVARHNLELPLHPEIY